jgi:hypothetical protein
VGSSLEDTVQLSLFSLFEDEGFQIRHIPIKIPSIVIPAEVSTGTSTLIDFSASEACSQGATDTRTLEESAINWSVDIILSSDKQPGELLTHHLELPFPIEAIPSVWSFNGLNSVSKGRESPSAPHSNPSPAAAPSNKSFLEQRLFGITAAFAGAFGIVFTVLVVYYLRQRKKKSSARRDGSRMDREQRALNPLSSGSVLNPLNKSNTKETKSNAAASEKNKKWFCNRVLCRNLISRVPLSTHSHLVQLRTFAAGAMLWRRAS